MKVVLDTNVIIAAFASRGLCADVLEYCLYEQTIVLSEYLLDEVHDKLCQKLKIPKSKADDVRKFLSSEAKMVIPAKLAGDICRDIDDINVLGTALSGQAEAIVTGDKDLLILKKFESIPILTPRGFWEFIQKKC